MPPQLAGEERRIGGVADAAADWQQLRVLAEELPHAARRDRRVLVVTGDGELLMNVGALATIALLNPPNLSIICVDNGHYGETGYQKSHTSLGTDLEKMAQGAGIKLTRTVQHAADIPAGTQFLRQGNGTVFLLLRVNTGEPPVYKRIWDPAVCRAQFQAALSGT